MDDRWKPLVEAAVSLTSHERIIFFMTNAAKQLLDSFEALPAQEQQEVLAQLLRRLMASDYDNVSEAAMLQAADAVFQDYDRREGAV